VLSASGYQAIAVRDERDPELRRGAERWRRKQDNVTQQSTGPCGSIAGNVLDGLDRLAITSRTWGAVDGR
jgi:hypothetical protein